MNEDNEYSSTGEPVQWLSEVPKTCETCDEPIKDTFIDGKTKQGPWACMCPTCHILGPGIGKLGTGLGQRYVFQAATKIWLKVEG